MTWFARNLLASIHLVLLKIHLWNAHRLMREVLVELRAENDPRADELAHIEADMAESRRKAPSLAAIWQ